MPQILEVITRQGEEFAESLINVSDPESGMTHFLDSFAREYARLFVDARQFTRRIQNSDAAMSNSSPDEIVDALPECQSMHADNGTDCDLRFSIAEQSLREALRKITINEVANRDAAELVVSKFFGTVLGLVAAKVDTNSNDFITCVNAVFRDYLDEYLRRFGCKADDE